MLLEGLAAAHPDVYVYPRRAGQSAVQPYDFEWQSIVLFEGEDGEGGVRLLFYDRERAVAERAAAVTRDAMLELDEDFGGRPQERFPLVLYSSYHEFLRTNLFPLHEGILGVTSPRNLVVSLPWFGDEREFARVGEHELAHQYTIQKVRKVAKEARTFTDPLDAIPLWFIEGLAEYYAQDGLDDEAEMVARDLVANPIPEYGIGLHGFFDDAPWDVSWTYKLGQVRCAFLEETYGKGTIQRLLEASPQLVGRTGGHKRLSFPGLVEKVTGDPKDLLDAKFESWVKTRAFQGWLEAEQATAEIRPLQDLEQAYILAMDASPDGKLLLFRTYDPERGTTRLHLSDPRNPRDWRQIAIDNRPGTESLHPIAERNFDLGDGQLVYVAETGGRDVIVWQKFTTKARERAVDPDLEERVPTPDEGEWHPRDRVDEKETEWAISFRLGDKRRFDLKAHDIVAIDSPSLSPAGDAVAFVGLDLHGHRDLYVLEPQKDDFTLRRLTDDRHAERELSWGPGGIVYTSDATEHGHRNVFRVDPAAGPGPGVALATEARDQGDPLVTPDGRVYFTAFATGHNDVYEIVGDEVVRRTYVTTGVFDPAPGPEGGLWTLLFMGGRRIPAHVASPQLLDVGRTPAAPAQATRPSGDTLSLAAAKPYQSYNPKNWQLDGIIGFAGAGSGGIYGQVLASSSDLLRNHGITLDLAMYGRPEYTDGALFFIDQSHRVTWGGGPFQGLRFRLEETEHGNMQFLSGERFFGIVGSVRYPFDRFFYVQGDLATGGSAWFVFPETQSFLESRLLNGTGRDLYAEWAEDHVGVEFQSELTLRAGVDTVGYHVRTGPYTGGSVLLEGMFGTQPFNEQVYVSGRLDAARYFPIVGAANLFLRGGAGTSGGGELAQEYYLSSFDTLRGVPYGDADFLLGRHYTFGTAELQVPLDAIVRVAFVSNLEGVAGIDAGATGNRFDQMWDRRVLDAVLGTNIILGPIVFRIHFAHPFDVGAPLPTEQNWIANISLDALYG